MVRAGQYFNNTGYGLIDSLNYTYSDPLSNQLTNIFEQTPGIQKNKGFKPGPSSGYLYDENGNLISDTHKNMSIQYNYLNLPETINFAGGNQIVYLYDATGKKLQKKVSPDNTGTTTLNQNPIPSDTYQDNEIHSAGNVPNGHHVVFKGSSRIRLNDGFQGYGRFRGENTGTIVQDYCSGIEYHCSILEAIYHSEGRLYFEGDGERYEYTLADHLGNSRVTFADIDGNGTISAGTEILQENHYYPFGLAQEGNWTGNTGNPNDYLYNGKELDTDFGLNWYHYGARMYDPAIGRWNSVDPVADISPEWSPFRYGFNNPIKFIDPDGKYEWRINSQTGDYERFGDKGGTDRTYIYFDDDTESSFDFEGSNFQIGPVANNWHSDGEFTYTASPYRLWDDIPDEYLGEYTAFDLAERYEAKQNGDIKYESIKKQETAGLSRQEMIWNNKDYGLYLDNQYGSQTGFIMAYDTGLLGSMIPGGFNQAARAGHNALRGGASNARNFSPKFNSVTPKSNSVTPQAKMSWNEFQKATKGQFKGANSRIEAAKAFKQYKASFN